LHRCSVLKLRAVWLMLMVMLMMVMLMLICCTGVVF